MIWRNIYELWHDKTNKMSVHPAKTQISLGIRHVWSESSLCAQWVAKDPRFLHADSEDSWVFARCTLILLVLSCCSSYLYIPDTRLGIDITCTWTYQTTSAWCETWQSHCFLLGPRHDKTCLWEFLTRPNSNRPAQPQKLATVMKFRL